MTFFRTSLLTIAAVTLTACGQPTGNAAGDAPAADREKATILNLYSSRHYDTDLALYDEFTEQTGIKINRLEASADELIERLKAEGEFSPADLLITVDAGRLWRAEEAGLLSSVSSDVLEQRIPSNLRHPDGLWFGLSKRARVIIYNKDRGAPEGLSTYEDLADPAYQGQICMRSSSNIYNLSLMASLIDANGAEAAEAWAKGVVSNFARPPQGNDTAQINAVAAGECGISVVNTYYLARFAGSEDADDRAVFDRLGIIFPNQDGRGTHVNISGAGVLKSAPNREAAIAFLEYLTDAQAQSYLANGNNEYPVVEGVAPTAAVVQLGTFREDTVNASVLGENQAEAVRIYDRANWP